MPMISTKEAVDRIAHAIHILHDDEIVEAYNELFPADSTTQEEVYADKAKLLEQMTEYVDKGLEIEEVVDLWNVLFPQDRNVYYDEETARIHYDRASAPISQMD